MTIRPLRWLREHLKNHNRRQTPATRQARLILEGLEERDVPAAPTISAIGKQFESLNTQHSFAFTVNDAEDPASTLQVTALSSNLNVIGNGGLTIGPANPSSGARTLTINPILGATGVSIINLSVKDSQNNITSQQVPVLVTNNQTLTFTDNFNRADNPFLGVGWDEKVGDFADVGNVGVGNSMINVATLRGVSETDVTLSADVNVTGASGRSGGLVARLTGSGANQSMYWAGLINNGGSYIATLYVNNAGIWTQLASKIVGSGNAWLRFEVAETSLKLFVNNALAVYANDASLTNGALGVRGSAGATFDNFAAAVLNLNSPSLPYTDTFGMPSNQQLSNDWLNEAGNFKVQNNATGQGAVNLATLNGAIQVGQVWVQADVNVQGAAGQYAGLVARHKGTGDKDMYWGTLTNTGAGYVAAIWVNNDGVWKQLFSQSVANGTGTMRFEAFGPSLKLFLNNSLIAWADDSSLSWGTVGIRGTAGATFDNFSSSILLAPVVSYPFSDNFNSATNEQLSNSWTHRTGNFKVASLVATGQSAVNVATTNAQVAFDVTVQAAVAITTAGEAGGLVARYSGSGDKDMYWAGIINTGSGYVAAIYVNDDGVWNLLSSKPVAISGSATLRFEAVSTSLKLFVDDVLAAFANDSTFAAGYTGIRGSAGAVFNNFSTDLLALNNANALPWFTDFGVPANKQLDNNWLHEAGNYEEAFKATGMAPLNLATINGITVADVGVHSDISVAGAAGQTAGIVLRHSGIGDKNMYFGAITNTGAGYVAAIWLNENGVWTQLAGAAVGNGAGNLRFQAVGSSLRLYFNFSLVAFANDDTWTTGKIGMRSTASAYLNSFSASAEDVNNNGGALPFNETFDNSGFLDQLNSSWTNRAGNIKVNNSVAQGIGDVNVATVNGINEADVKVEAVVTVTGVGQSAGVIARYSGTGDRNMYWAGLNNTGAGYVASIWVNIDGVWTQLDSRSVNVTGIATLRLEVVKTSLELYVDNALTAWGNDSTLTSGAVGVRGTTGAIFDTFSSEKLTFNNASLFFYDSHDILDLELGTEWHQRVGHFGVSAPSVVGMGTVNLATVNGISASNVWVDSSASVPNAGQSAGVVARYSGSGDGNMYLGVYSNTGAGYDAAIWLKNAGVWTLLGSKHFSNMPSASLRLQVIGNSLKLFCNYDLAVHVYDSTLTSGQIGMRVTKGASLGTYSADAIVMNNNGGSVPFNDGFADNSLDQLSTSWRERLGDFLVDNSVAKGTQAVNLATVNGISKDNIVVQTQYTVAQPGQWAGLVARYSGSGDKNMYWGAIANTGNGYTASIWLNHDGVWTQLASMAVNSQGIGTLRFEVSGTLLKLFINEFQFLSATDSTLTSGLIGVRSTAGARYDNFSAPFEDNFVGNGPLSSDWTTVVGQFNINSGTVEGSQSTNIAIVSGSSLRDTSMESTISLANNQSAGLVARYSSPNDMYVGYIARGIGTTSAVIYKKVGGVLQLLDFNTIPGVGAGIVEFKVSGTSLMLILDDVVVASATDSTFDSGSVGIYGSAGAGFYLFSAA